MAKAVFLEFEKDIGAIAAEIEALENQELETGKSERNAIAKLEKKMTTRTAEIYQDLTPWLTSQVARHPNRPYTMDYINAIFEDFHELHGDRNFADDQSIVGGLARLAEHSVVVIGHQKGRDTRERTRRNFGMTKPEGYRKALRLMKLAEKFGLPVFTFVDTPGAYPGIDAEERNQSEAIGRNIFELSKLKVPVISTIIGEGGSGGALAIAVADVVLMLQYSTYSVISPEGCASILWKSAEKASEAAQALGLTADRLAELGLIDKIVPEPLGGAHRDPKLMASTLRKALVDQLKFVQSMPLEELLERRLQRLLSYGRFSVSGVDNTIEVNDAVQTVEALPEAEAPKKVTKRVVAKKTTTKTTRTAAKKTTATTKAAKTTKTTRTTKSAKVEAEPVATVAEVEAKPAKSTTAKKATTARKTTATKRTTAAKSKTATTATKTE